MYATVYLLVYYWYIVMTTTGTGVGTTGTTYTGAVVGDSVSTTRSVGCDAVGPRIRTGS